MPKIDVSIEWDEPDEVFWLNADNVAIALHAHCPNTRFQVSALVCRHANKHRDGVLIVCDDCGGIQQPLPDHTNHYP